MAKLEIPKNPQFSTEVTKLEPTTPAHANAFNEINQKLLENEANLNDRKADKTDIEQLKTTWNNHTNNKNNPHSVTATQIGAAPTIHSHTVSQISGLPTSLPANGGNADTVDGKHAGDFLPMNSEYTSNGRPILVRPAGTEGVWSNSNLQVEKVGCNSNTDFPRISFHSSGAGVCKQIAGDHVRGGISVLNEDGQSLTHFNCSILKASNVVPSYVTPNAPGDTSAVWIW